MSRIGRLQFNDQMDFSKTKGKMKREEESKMESVDAGSIQDHPVKIITSPFVRCVQTSAYMGHAIYKYALLDHFSSEEFKEMQRRGISPKPIIFLANNLGNCLSRKFQEFFDHCQLQKSHADSQKFIKEELDDQINSYHYNEYGESVLFYPG